MMTWLPKRYKPGKKNVDGEPTFISLTLFRGDGALRGRVFVKCCECGLEHLVTYEIFRDRKGQYWMARRGYRCRMEGK